MRADRVVRVLPPTEFGGESRDGPGTGGDLIELLGMGALSAFDRAIEFRTTRREGKEPDLALLTGGFKVGEELRAAIDLNGPNGKGDPRLQGVEKLRQPLGSGLTS